ncbi:MAG: hypothetical protein ACE5HA_18515 [Anaerolineae bacterium]
MQLRALVIAQLFQLVVVSHSALHVLIHVGVDRANEAVPLGRYERADADVVAILLQTTPDEEAGAVDLGGGLPAQQDLSLAGGGCEADQGDGGVGGAGGRVE